MTTRQAFIATLTSIAVAFLMIACAAVKNTPAQDEAWRRWAACQSQVRGVDIQNVQLDGRISFSATGVFQGQSMLDCLARARTNGPALPEATYVVRNGGA